MRTTTDISKPMTAAEVGQAVFTPVWLEESYDPVQVDRFLDELARELSAETPEMTVASVAATRFTPARMRPGYRIVEVDRFLAWAKATLRSRHGDQYRPPDSDESSRS